VFADTEPFTCFLQFAAALRRRGVVCVRVTTRARTTRQRAAQIMQRLVFRRVDVLLGVAHDGSVTGVDLLADWLEGVAVAVEATDDVAAALAARSSSVGDHRLLKTRAGRLESVLYDKWALMQFAPSVGVSVPRSWRDADPSDASYPLLVKPRLGFGGQGIRTVNDRAEHEQVVADLSLPIGGFFAQEVMAGDRINLGGVAKAGRIVAVGCYWSWPQADDPMGPPALVAMTHNPQLIEAGERLIAGLDYTGAFCLNFIQGPGGRPHLIDFNSRLFGSWLALQRAGVDIVGAYLHAYDLNAGAQPRSEETADHPQRWLPDSMAIRAAPRVTGVVSPHAINRRTISLLGTRWLIIVCAQRAASTLWRLLSAPITRRSTPDGGHGTAGRSASPSGSVSPTR